MFHDMSTRINRTKQKFLKKYRNRLEIPITFDVGSLENVQTNPFGSGVIVKPKKYSRSWS